MKTKTILYIILVFIPLSIVNTSCQSIGKDKQQLFESYTNQFELTNLPIDTNLLYRVHNNPMIKNRIDTVYVQSFIDDNYQLRLDMPVYDGYAYGIRLPKEEYAYESLIHYKSDGREQFFILNTYTSEGVLKGSLPISGDSSSYKRITVEITESRTILLRESILNQPDSISREMLFEIDLSGTIVPLDTFYN